jgi:hypothetical protein
MLRIAIYARVSTTDKGQDTENQLRELRQFVVNKSSEGWTLADEYVDHATGKNANRPEFQRLFRDAAEGKFDLVLFWSLDRFTREGVLETLQHLQRLTGNGIDWWSHLRKSISAASVRSATRCFRSSPPSPSRSGFACRNVSRRVWTVPGRKARLVGRPKIVVDRAKVLELHGQGLSQWDISQGSASPGECRSNHRRKERARV